MHLNGVISEPLCTLQHNNKSIICLPLLSLQDQLPRHLQGGGDDMRRASQRAGDKPIARGDHILRPVGEEVRREPTAILWPEPCACIRSRSGCAMCFPSSNGKLAVSVMFLRSKLREIASPAGLGDEVWVGRHRRCTLLPWPLVKKKKRGSLGSLDQDLSTGHT